MGFLRSCIQSGALASAWLLLAILGMSIGCSASDIEVVPTPGGAGLPTLPVSLRNQTPGITPTTEAERTITPTPGPTESPDPSSITTPTPTPAPANTATPTNGTISVSLKLLAPAAGADVEVGAVRVLGRVTGPNYADATVKVNGVETDAASDGTFQRDLLLQEGINSVEAVATGPYGGVAFESVVVLFVPRPEGVPLSVLFPQGLEVQEPRITIIGASRQDAVVGVNGIPVDVNSLGIFSAEVPLEEGANLIEVVAVDLEENINFQTVVIFYIPKPGAAAPG